MQTVKVLKPVVKPHIRFLDEGERIVIDPTFQWG